MDVINLFEEVSNWLNDTGKDQYGDLPDLPAEARDFLGRLSLLDGVPLYNLIPDERYLPRLIVDDNVNGTLVPIEIGSLKLFWLDTDWIACLIDGAVSVCDNMETRKLLLRKAMAGNYAAEVLFNRAKEQIKKQLAGLYSPDELKTQLEKRLSDKHFQFSKEQVGDETITCYMPLPTAAQNNLCYTGFLIRSVLIASWVGVEIKASGKYPFNASEPEHPLQVIRFERIAADTMLCICEGVITNITITQPAETLHFGVDESGEGTDIKYTKQKQLQSTGPVEVKTTYGDGTRANGVIDLLALKQGLEANNSAAFAQAMLARPLKVNLFIDWSEETFK
jgi:hypothetical protein